MSSSNTNQMSPTRATLFCLNSMIGAGLFINPKPLTLLAGSYGFLSYIIGAIILLPLPFCLAELATLFPVAGGLYFYNESALGKWAGFLGAWGYFIGKLGAISIITYKFIEYFHTRIPAMQTMPILFWHICILFLFVFLNSIGVSLGGRVQPVFTFLKGVPILFVIIAGFFCFSSTSFAAKTFDASGILSSLSIAMFPLVGFEIVCAVGHQIRDGRNNIKKVIISAFFIVSIVAILFQFAAFAAAGSDLITANESVFTVGQRFLGDCWLVSIINAMVFAAIFGSSFSMLIGNAWNLFALAKQGHFPGSTWICKVNRKHVPWVCLLIEVLIGSFIILVTSEQTALQKLGVFGMVTSYLMTAISALYMVQQGKITSFSRIVPILGICSASYIVAIAFSGILNSGLSFPIIGIFTIGCLLALGQYYKKRQN